MLVQVPGVERPPPCCHWQAVSIGAGPLASRVTEPVAPAMAVLRIGGWLKPGSPAVVAAVVRPNAGISETFAVGVGAAAEWAIVAARRNPAGCGGTVPSGRSAHQSATPKSANASHE